MKRKPVWANGVNLSGLWSLKPIRMTWKRDLEEYYDKSGNISCEGTGLCKEPCITTFASTSRKEVVTWTLGVIAAFNQVSRLTDVRPEIYQAEESE